MSKELELLKDLATMAGDEEYHELIFSSQEYLKLKQALTPPTAEEVCDALSEWCGKKVIFTHNRFYVNWTEISKTSNTTNERLSVIELNSLMKAPHLITMLGRFYEAQNETE